MNWPEAFVLVTFIICSTTIVVSVFGMAIGKDKPTVPYKTYHSYQQFNKSEPDE